MSEQVAVVWLLCGVKPKPGTREPDPKNVRRAVQALRKEGFVANTASSEAIVAQAEAIRVAADTDRTNNHQRKAVEK